MQRLHTCCRHPSVSSQVAHVALQAIDNKPTTYFSSGSMREYAWLQLDLGPSGPYYEELKNVTVRLPACSHRCRLDRRGARSWGPPPAAR